MAPRGLCAAPLALGVTVARAKTTSILWPQVFQDAMDGKGVLVMDAKGSDANAQTMRSIAAAVGREEQLRIFALPAWNRPQLFSHTYNMVHVARLFRGGHGRQCRRYGRACACSLRTG